MLPSIACGNVVDMLIEWVQKAELIVSIEAYTCCLYSSIPCTVLSLVPRCSRGRRNARYTLSAHALNLSEIIS